MAVTKYTIKDGPRRGVTLYEVDGFNFETKADAEAFAGSDWPRTMPDGRLVTSDRVSFPASKAALATARQKNLEA